MPKVNNSKNLADYRRTRQWELRRNLRRIECIQGKQQCDEREGESSFHDCLDQINPHDVQNFHAPTSSNIEIAPNEGIDPQPSCSNTPDNVSPLIATAVNYHEHGENANSTPNSSDNITSNDNDENTNEHRPCPGMNSNDMGPQYLSSQTNDGEELSLPDDASLDTQEDSDENQDSEEDSDENQDSEEDGDENQDNNDSQSSSDDENDVANDANNANGGDGDPENPEDVENDLDQPLYDGASITVGESMLSTLIYSFTYNLSGVAFSALLKLMSVHMGNNSKFKETAYYFWKFFEDMETAPTKHYYCSGCNSPVEDINQKCDECTDNPEKNYFIELDIADQLNTLLQRPGFSERLGQQYEKRNKQKEDGIEDIYDGLLYKEYTRKRNPLKNKYTLSFMWYADGAPVFKSRKFSVWPLYLIINELPYAERIKKENIIVAGLWFGPTDPDVNMFLHPIYKQLKKLRSGVMCKVSATSNEQQLVKAYLLCGTGDAPARAEFMNHHRFNGKFGCLHCLSMGYNIGENRKATHIYPYEGTPCEGEGMPHEETGTPVLRTHEMQKQHADMAMKDDQPVYGVKGPSLLSLLMPDAIRGLSIDGMHCVDSGVVKRSLVWWFDPAYKDEPFSLVQYKDVIDERLTAIKPPNSIKRMPRSISKHLNYFKASELKAWFFFYSVPVLDGIMKPEYFAHYLQLVLGVFLLNQNSINADQINLSRQLLSAFVCKLHVLYDEKFSSFNIHSLLHLPDVVENLGPLWVTSCYPYEDMLGTLVGYVHGTRYVGLQIFSKVVRHQVLISKLDKLEDNSRVKTLCQAFMTTGKRHNPEKKITSNSFVLGKIKKIKRISGALQDCLIGVGIDFRQRNVNVFTFKKLKKSSLTVFARKIDKKNKTVSSWITIGTENGEKIGSAEIFLKICYCNNRNGLCKIRCSDEATFFVVFREAIIEKPYKAPLDMSLLRDMNPNDVSWTELPFIHRMSSSNEMSPLININQIKNVCCFVKINNVITLVQPSNVTEYDE